MQDCGILLFQIVMIVSGFGDYYVKIALPSGDGYYNFHSVRLSNK